MQQSSFILSAGFNRPTETVGVTPYIKDASRQDNARRNVHVWDTQWPLRTCRSNQLTDACRPCRRLLSIGKETKFLSPPPSPKKKVDPQKRHGRVLPARFFYSTFPGTQLHAGGSSCGSLQKLATKLNRAHRMVSNETLMLPGSPIETQRYMARTKGNRLKIWYSR
jgi:hypothetical protein